MILPSKGNYKFITLGLLIETLKSMMLFYGGLD